MYSYLNKSLLTVYCFFVVPFQIKRGILSTWSFPLGIPGIVSRGDYVQGIMFRGDLMSCIPWTNRPRKQNKDNQRITTESCIPQRSRNGVGPCMASINPSSSRKFLSLNPSLGKDAFKSKCSKRAEVGLWSFLCKARKILVPTFCRWLGCAWQCIQSV